MSLAPVARDVTQFSVSQKNVSSYGCVSETATSHVTGLRGQVRGSITATNICYQYPEAQAATPALEIHSAGSLGKRPARRVERAQGLAELHQVPDLQASYLLSRLGGEVRRVAKQTAALGDLPPPGNSEPRCCGTVAWGRHPPGGDKAVCCGAAPAMIERAPAREGALEPADRSVRGGDRE